MAFITRLTDSSIICTVPVKVPDVAEFCKSSDTYKMSEKISGFVSKKIAEFGKKKDDQYVDRYDIQEMIKNSFDSFISLGTIKVGSALEFSATVKREGKNIIIKFKDNGRGIDRQRKGKYFKVNELRSTKRCFIGSKKYAYSYFGGNGIGLWQMDLSIQRQGGTVKLKNRKLSGCTVYVTFGPTQTDDEFRMKRSEAVASLDAAVNPSPEKKSRV